MLFYVLNFKNHTFKTCHTVHEVYEYFRESWDTEEDLDNIEIINCCDPEIRYDPWKFMDEFYEEGRMPENEVIQSIVEYLVFEHTTSEIYPFLKSYEETTLKDVQKIAKLCNGNDETETIYDCGRKILGTRKEK